MSSESLQHKLDRVRRPRVQITYDVETNGAMVKTELPFVVGVMADLSAQPKEALRPLKERKFVPIDRDNFNDVLKIRANLHVIPAQGWRRDVWFDQPDALSPTDPIAAVKPGSIGLVHPFYVGETLVGTLAVGKSRLRTPFTAAKINVVHTFADFLAIQIVNARLQEERVNTLLVARDLEIAQNIQRSLLLKSLPQMPGLELAGYCVSARQVGGDFYDVIKLSDTELLLVIADVMGKGIPAAMFAVILRSLLRALPELTNRPSELLARANQLLFDELSKVDMFITAQLVFVDARARRLVAASAGHCPMLIAESGHVRTVSPEGMPLGIVADTSFSDETATLDQTCRVLLYTDGLTEARSPDGELFGAERLAAWLKKSAAAPHTAEQLKDQLASELSRFQANIALNDDQTFLIMA